MTVDSKKSTKTADICNEMQQVRCSLGDDVGDFVESARTLSDWRYYARKYPWACLAGAAALGFWVVPKRLEIHSPNAADIEALARRNKLVVESNPSPRHKNGMGRTLFTLLANAAVRGAIGYLGHSAGELLGGDSHTRGET
jgi:hypothetical protein